MWPFEAICSCDTRAQKPRISPPQVSLTVTVVVRSAVLLVVSRVQTGFVPGPLPGVLNSLRSVALFGTTLYTTTNNAIVQVSNVP